MEEKDRIRKKLLEERNHLSPKFVFEHSHIIIDNFMNFFGNISGKNIMLYSAFRNEVKTNLLERCLKDNGNTLCFPITGTDTITAAVPATGMHKGKYGIEEPSEDSVIISEEELDMIVAPGVVFDIYKNRLGFGKGYYDRFFKRTNAKRVALAYHFQVLDEKLPVNKDDVPMDIIFTEREIID